MKKYKKKQWIYWLLTIVILAVLGMVFRYFGPRGPGREGEGIVSGECISPMEQGFALEQIPPYTGSPYYEVNNNIPYFKVGDYPGEAFEIYSDLDFLGRCGVTIARVCRELMPTGEREPIGAVKPTAWHYTKYDFVNGKYLYNRCHLIGFQLTGENANERNLITGTRYMNVEGMLPFENQIAEYVHSTGGAVLYRVTPCFRGKDLLAQGVLLEALSLEDEAEGVCFNVFCYNVQPGVEIDYATGDNRLVP